MGSSATAIIAYGIPFDEQEVARNHPNQEDHFDIEVWLAQHQGLPQPPKPYEQHRTAWTEYYEKRKTLPITTQCSGNLCDGHLVSTYLTIKESELDADWRIAKTIPPNHLQKMDHWDQLLLDFCKNAEIKCQQPNWLLIANYG